MTETQEFQVDPEYMEKCMVKSMFQDKKYCILLSQKFKSAYFDTDEVSIIFRYMKEHIEEYKDLPQKEIIINSIQKEEDRTRVQRYIHDAGSMEFDIDANQD